MKIKILGKNKKNFLKENCGVPASPKMLDLEAMSSQEAYNAGYNDAIAEVNAMLAEMSFGGIPVDAAVPVEIEDVVQLEEEDEPLQKLAKGVEDRGTEGEFSDWCGGKVTQACVNRGAKEGGKRAQQASLAATFSKAKGGGPTLKYPKKKK
tara:strand:+ start:1820 stop:2272 length:453 start_codon:yes stop_codon:yes gene_type:complete